MCEDSFKVNEPPNAEARAKQFMDLSAEYLRVVPPRIKTPSYYTDSNPEALESLREGLLAHMLMRKFITKGESVYIPRVYEKLLTDYREQIPKPLAKELRSFMHELSGALKSVTGLSVQYGINGAETVSSKVMLDSYLNGRLLHSDHDKWGRANGDAFRIMLGSWTHMRVRFRDHLNASRHNVRLVAREHNLFSIPGDDPELV